jgi:hypothetical protein
MSTRFPLLFTVSVALSETFYKITSKQANTTVCRLSNCSFSHLTFEAVYDIMVEFIFYLYLQCNGNFSVYRALNVSMFREQQIRKYVKGSGPV